MPDRFFSVIPPDQADQMPTVVASAVEQFRECRMFTITVRTIPDGQITVEGRGSE